MDMRIHASSQETDHFPVCGRHPSVLRFKVCVICIECIQESSAILHICFDGGTEKSRVSSNSEDSFAISGQVRTYGEIRHVLWLVDINHLPGGFILDTASPFGGGTHENCPRISEGTQGCSGTGIDA